MILSECVKQKSDPIIKLSEAKSNSATFKNPKRLEFQVIRFDGCVVKNSLACDWVIATSNTGVLAVELKGSNVDHAVLQILATLEYIKEKELFAAPYAGLVVCSRYPRMDTKVQRLKQQMARRFEAPLHVLTHAEGLAVEALMRFSTNAPKKRR